MKRSPKDLPNRLEPFVTYYKNNLTVKMLSGSRHIKRKYKVSFNGVEKTLFKRNDVDLLWFFA